MCKNEYNTEIVAKLNRNLRSQIQRDTDANRSIDTPLTSRLESSTLRDADIVGGSGYGASTVGDMGFSKTNGIVGSGIGETSVLETNNNIPRKRKPREKKQGGAMLSLANIDTDPRSIVDSVIDNKPHEKTAPTTNPEQPIAVKRKVKHAVEGGAAPRKVNKYALLVKEIMAKHSIKKIS